MTNEEVRLANLLGLKHDQVDDKTLELIRYALSHYTYMHNALKYCQKVLRCN